MERAAMQVEAEAVKAAAGLGAQYWSHAPNIGDKRRAELFAWLGIQTAAALGAAGHKTATIDDAAGTAGSTIALAGFARGRRDVARASGQTCGRP
jgi:hypothetical protein